MANKKKNNVIEEIVEEKTINENTEEVIDDEIVDENTEEVIDDEIVDENTEEVIETETEIPNKNDSEDFGEEEPEIIKGIVICDALNVRLCPDITSKIIGVLYKGENINIVDLESSNPEFCTIEYGDSIAYCMKKFISIPN